MTMPKRSRFRRILKWNGVVLCVVLIAAWAASCWWAVLYSNGTTFQMFLAGGRSQVIWSPAPTSSLFGVSLLQERGLHVAVPKKFLGSGLLLPSVKNAAGVRILELPLWLPLVIIATPTAYVSWLDRRRRIPPGHCQRCGYNLTGNVSGICSECGTKIAAD